MCIKPMPFRLTTRMTKPRRITLTISNKRQEQLGLLS